MQETSKPNSYKSGAVFEPNNKKFWTRGVWFVLVFALFLVAAFSTIVLQHPETAAKKFVMSLVEEKLNFESKKFGNNIECRPIGKIDFSDFQTPVRCSVPTSCNTDIDLLVFVSRLGIASIGPDPFSYQAARICPRDLKSNVLDELEMDHGG